MKNKSLILILILALFACKKQSPSEYNDKIIKEQIAIVDKLDKMRKALDDYNLLPEDKAFQNMDAAYDSLIFQIDSSIARVKKMGSFQDDSTLQQAALKLFNEYKNITEKNYKRVIELYKIPDKMFTQEDRKEMDSLIADINSRTQKAYEEFIKVQKEFAKKNNLELIKKE